MGQQRQNGLAEWEDEMMLSDDEVDDRLWDGAYKMAGALFRGQTPRDVPVGPSGTPTWHLGPRRRHTPKTRVPACRTLRQATRRFLLSRPPQNKRPTRPV